MTRSPGWTPNYKAFLVTGAVLGFVAGAVVALLRPPSGAYSQGSEIGYVGLFGAVIGMAVAGVVALVADSIGRRSIPPAEPGRSASPGPDAPSGTNTADDVVTPAGSEETPTAGGVEEDGPEGEARGGRER